MTGPILALRSAIRALAEDDAALAALLAEGTPGLHDEPPRGAPAPVLHFGAVSVEDWSTDEMTGHRQDLTLVTVGRAGAASVPLKVADRLSELLHRAELALAGHRLVSLRVTALDLAREGGSPRATLRLRALTEAL